MEWERVGWISRQWFDVFKGTLQEGRGPFLTLTYKPEWDGWECRVGVWGWVPYTGTGPTPSEAIANAIGWAVGDSVAADHGGGSAHRVGDEWELPGLHRQTVRDVDGERVRFDAFGWRTPEQLRGAGWRRVRSVESGGAK